MKTQENVQLNGQTPNSNYLYKTMQTDASTQ